MALDLERYDHFKNWLHRHACFGKATSTFRSGKIYLICIFCCYETPISPQGNSWNIGTFTRHLKASPKCILTVFLVFAFSIALQDTATVEVTQRIVESIEWEILDLGLG